LETREKQSLEENAENGIKQQPNAEKINGVLSRIL
jgi:hypothetical protein